MTRRMRLNEGNRRWWTLAAMCFALFMIMLDNTVVNVALPSIQRELGATLPALEWTVNIYTLTFAVLLVTGGRLGDILGRRRMFLFGVVVFAVSSAAIGLAPDQGWLIAGRAIQGVGAAFMRPATDVCRSRWIDGSATLTTVLSSMTMNSAKHMAASVHQRRLSSLSARARRTSCCSRRPSTVRRDGRPSPAI